MIDLLFRAAYRAAYRLMRVYWALAHPRTHGALVALWHEGELLLVQNSYVPYRSLPGGYVRRRERGAAAACRELREELGLAVAPEALRPALELHHRWEGKREHLELFELEPAERPVIRVDRREVVEARWFTPEAALAERLFPPIREVVRRRLAGQGAAAPPRQAVDE